MSNCQIVGGLVSLNGTVYLYPLFYLSFCVLLVLIRFLYSQLSITFTCHVALKVEIKTSVVSIFFHQAQLLGLFVPPALNLPSQQANEHILKTGVCLRNFRNCRKDSCLRDSTGLQIGILVKKWYHLPINLAVCVQRLLSLCQATK